MKHIDICCLIPCLALFACQPYFPMVPPGEAVQVTQEFNDNWYVTQDGSGVKNGSDWNNALPFQDFVKMISNATTALSDAGIHIQEGEYVVTGADEVIKITKDILCIRGGYSSELEYDDLSKCDPDLYPTVFMGEGAFIYLTEGNIRFDNIEFRGFKQSAAIAESVGGKGSAVFGINGPYLTTSVECRNCIFRDNVNEVAGTSSQEGGPCAYVAQGYFKAKDCTFTGNSANSRGGAIRTIGKQAVLYLDRCLFTGNSLTGGNFGSAIQNSDGVICMNNCTLVGNHGGGATLNGGGAFFIANSTIIDDSALSGTTNAAFRCESKKDAGTTIINSVFGNANAGGCGIVVNSNGATLISKGYNFVKSVSLGEGCVDPTVGDDIKKDIVLAGTLDEGVWQWDIEQIAEDMKEYATEDDVYDAALNFNPALYSNISVLGRAYATWVTALAFSVDGRGEDRGEDGFQPGSYDPNLD